MARVLLEYLFAVSRSTESLPEELQASLIPVPESDCSVADTAST